MAAVVYGPDIAHSSLAPYFTWDRKSIQIMLAVYSFFAAALPVWLLLAPRGYLSTYMKVGTIGALALGIILVMPVLSQMVGEDLMHRPGGAVSLAVGMAHIFSKIPNMDHLMSYWYHFCIMFEALFILTLIDTGTRVSRYMVQELLGMAWPQTLCMGNYDSMFLHCHHHCYG